MIIKLNINKYDDLHTQIYRISRNYDLWGKMISTDNYIVIYSWSTGHYGTDYESIKIYDANYEWIYSYEYDSHIYGWTCGEGGRHKQIVDGFQSVIKKITKNLRNGHFSVHLQNEYFTRKHIMGDWSAIPPMNDVKII